FRGKLHGMKRTLRKQRIDAVTERCGLEKIRKRVIGHLSRGNRQRVGLAQALLHDPKVLILDEPTAGFDPTQVSQVRQLIHELKGQHTILLSTHILPEIEMIADEAIIIAGGKIVARGTPEELRKNVGTRGAVLVEVKAAQEAVTRAMKQVQGVEEVKVESQPGGWCRAIVTSNNGKDLREPLGHAIVINGWQIREMRHESATLEQFFIQITATQQTKPLAPSR
ncbi:MAG: ABC transporter ATP-binding protein, partial [Phycisphaeraceae bacterium]